MRARLWSAQRHKFIHPLTHSQILWGTGHVRVTVRALRYPSEGTRAMAAPEKPFLPVEKIALDWGGGGAPTQKGGLLSTSLAERSSKHG